MRTTLTLDDDVAALLNRIHGARGGTVKDVVNEALRLGLARLESPRRPSARTYTRTVSLGRPTLPDVDDVAEALALLEDDAHR